MEQDFPAEAAEQVRHAIAMTPYVMLGVGVVYGMLAALFSVVLTWFYNLMAYLFGGIHHRSAEETPVRADASQAGQAMP
ncbi:MAG: hypothetical protein KM310_01615 [Clostridiales bacterium]|nr:hypothetical protein [Clostridiales bacterium]